MSGLPQTLRGQGSLLGGSPNRGWHRGGLRRSDSPRERSAPPRLASSRLDPPRSAPLRIVPPISALRRSGRTSGCSFLHLFQCSTPPLRILRCSKTSSMRTSTGTSPIARVRVDCSPLSWCPDCDNPSIDRISRPRSDNWTANPPGCTFIVTNRALDNFVHNNLIFEAVQPAW